MKLVLAHGTFDWLHYGHVVMLKEARKLGDFLVVSLTADEFIAKGPGRPVFSEDERFRFLSELRCVDTVFICYAESAIPAIEAFRPAVYVKGGDYLMEDKLGHLAAEKELTEKLGGRLHILDSSPKYSSTDIIRRLHATRSHDTPS
jgi:rfaE bifunctional protein nucleotidyltransferase chain/domain